jgi:hypothetical protein
MANRYGVWGAAWAQVISAAVYAGLQSIWGWVVLYRKAGFREGRRNVIR